MAFTPRTFRKGNRTEVANSLTEETSLVFDGWTPDNGQPYTPPPAFSAAALAELSAAYVVRDPAVTSVLASAATFPVVVGDESWLDITLNQDVTFSLSGGTTGKKRRLNLIVRQDATGSRTITWPSAVTWLQGSPRVPSAANAVARFEFVSIDGGTTWLATGYGSAVRVAKARRTSGTITFTLASWVAVDAAGGLDLTVAAKVGDNLLVGINGTWANQAVNGRLDVATMVGGNPVNWVSTQSGTQGQFGIQAWAGNSGLFNGIGPTMPYTVAASDVASGTVTLRHFAKLDSASTKTLLAQGSLTGNPLDVWVANVG